jgi:hypothetical protein
MTTGGRASDGDAHGDLAVVTGRLAGLRRDVALAEASLHRLRKGIANERSRQRMQRNAQDARASTALGGIWRRSTDAAESQAWWARLDSWTWSLILAHGHLWPDQRRRTSSAPSVPAHDPWPACWRRHPALVEALVAIRRWEEGLLSDAEWAGGARGWLELHHWIAQGLRQLVVDIARSCEAGHVDEEAAWRERWLPPRAAAETAVAPARPREA